MTNASALFPCPDCGREVSRKAVLCPQCGRNIAEITIEQTGKKWKAWKAFFVLLLLVGVISFVIGFSHNDLSSDKGSGYIAFGFIGAVIGLFGTLYVNLMVWWHHK